MKLNIRDVAFDFITSNVASDAGLAVGAAGLSITEERKQTVDFSTVYASSTLVIISATANSFDSVADLAGKTVAVQQGTSGDLIITDAEIATVQQYQTYAVCMEELASGRVDAILMDELPAYSLVATASDPNAFAVVAASDLASEDFGIAFKKGADETLVNTVNQVITEWLANGNMAAYIEYYTSLDIYDRGVTEEAPVAPEGLKLSWDV